MEALANNKRGKKKVEERNIITITGNPLPPPPPVHKSSYRSMTVKGTIYHTLRVQRVNN